tara:strand:+ start:225 stop:416 length:192 start_codon:yes stop_codon:yes gene_type:complete
MFTVAAVVCHFASGVCAPVLEPKMFYTYETCQDYLEWKSAEFTERSGGEYSLSIQCVDWGTET